MDWLPPEIIFGICYYLTANEVVRLQQASRRLFSLTRDNGLWKSRCYEDSRTAALRRRQELVGRVSASRPAEHELQEAVFASLTGAVGEQSVSSVSEHVSPGGTYNSERRSAIASWDPSYDEEQVNWYQEYVHRNAPISLSWLQQPHAYDGGSRVRLEARGFALYKTHESNTGHNVLAALNDGSVCLWDVWGQHEQSDGRCGAVVARSKAGLLSAQPPSSSNDHAESPWACSKEIVGEDVIECVSVDHVKDKAYFAVEGGLNEVDLHTLQLVSHSSFDQCITAISQADFPVPVTVGTTLGLHLHDPRDFQAKQSSGRADIERCEVSATSLNQRLSSIIHNPTAILDQRAALFEPEPVSILHLPAPDGSAANKDDIYIAGRFPSILHYDRRYWPKLHRTIHSGARLSSLTWFPKASPSLGATNVVLDAQSSTVSAPVIDETLDTTLVACGEYNGKGSMEMYGLSLHGNMDSSRPVTAIGNPKNANYKNRQTASGSKLLSVANHGTRLVMSDGNGMLKWMERDGKTEVRRWNIQSASDPANELSNMFQASREQDSSGGSSGDVARKIVPIVGKNAETSINQTDLMILAGDRLGHLSFSTSGIMDFEDEESNASSVEPWKRREEAVYGSTMRRALERQADEVRFMQGLGLGVRSES